MDELKYESALEVVHSPCWIAWICGLGDLRIVPIASLSILLSGSASLVDVATRGGAFKQTIKPNFVDHIWRVNRKLFVQAGGSAC